MSLFGRMMDKFDNDDEVKEAAEAVSAVSETVKPDAVSPSPEALKAISDRCLATAALSMYCAACDGNISIEEYMEMDINIGSIKGKNKLSAEVEKELDDISRNHNITWDEVVKYLDRLSPDILMKMSDDVADVMVASDGVNEAEQAVVDRFANYVKSRI